MFDRFFKWVRENVRCWRHNLKHLKVFRIHYARGLWHVTDGQVKMVFSHYPYLAFHDIEGYLFTGRWKPQSGDVVVDAGGCFGEFSIYCSKRVGLPGKVLMLEPDRDNLQVAEDLVRLNGCEHNIELIAVGLWSSPTTLRFKAGQNQTSAYVENADVSEDVVEVPTVSLDYLVAEKNLSRLDWVKMDIEGAELEAMRGGAQASQALKPRYAIASYHIVEGEKTAIGLESYFKANDYHVETGNPRHLTTWAWIDKD